MRGCGGRDGGFNRVGSPLSATTLGMYKYMYVYIYVFVGFFVFNLCALLDCIPFSSFV